MFIIRKFYLFFICLNLGLALPVYAQDSTASDIPDAAAILRGETTSAREQWLRRQLFIENILTQTAVDLNDSTLFFRLQRKPDLGLDKSQLADIPRREDFIGERLRRDELEMPPLLNFSNLIGAGVKYLAEKFGRAATTTKQFALIPSELEIDVLKILWKENAATSSEIYAQLDSVRMTAADLQQALTIMTQRGLVARRQISPRNEFTLFGAAIIEMSGINRKNREYLYRPTISRQTMLTFLDATAFSYRIASTNSHALIDAHLRKLINKLGVMAQ